MIKKIFLSTIKWYQKNFSPLLGHHCRFYPSCSEYAVAAIRKHGSGKGLFLTCYRVLRCNPWHRGGIDEP